MICCRSSYSTAACSEGISSDAHIPCLVNRTPQGAQAAVVLQNLRHEADPLGLLRAHAPAGKHELVRSRGPDEAWQEPTRAHVAVRRADVDERDPEHGALARISDVATEGERHPESGSRTVDRGDHRLGRRPETQDQPRHVLLIRQMVAGRVAAVAPGRLSVAAEIDARAEPSTRPGDDNRAAGAVAAGHSERCSGPEYRPDGGSRRTDRPVHAWNQQQSHQGTG